MPSGRCWKHSGREVAASGDTGDSLLFACGMPETSMRVGVCAFIVVRFALSVVRSDPYQGKMNGEAGSSSQ
jgi:hypothetical protein